MDSRSVSKSKSRSPSKAEKKPSRSPEKKKEDRSPSPQDKKDSRSRSRSPKKKKTSRSRSGSRSRSASSSRSRSSSRRSSRSPSVTNKFQIGYVARISERGFGFIEPSDPKKKDVYFHCTAVRQTKFDHLREGDKVEFNVRKDDGHSGLRVQELYLVEDKRRRRGRRSPSYSRRRRSPRRSPSYDRRSRRRRY